MAKLRGDPDALFRDESDFYMDPEELNKKYVDNIVKADERAKKRQAER